MKPNDPEMQRFAEWQVSQSGRDPGFWDRLSAFEYQTVARVLLKAGVPGTVLDLGCGLGRAAAHFSKFIPSPPTRYFMADSTGEQPTCGWDAKPGFYTDLRLTERYMHECGAHDVTLVDLQTDALDKLTGIDLIMSFLSVGFHYPLEEYLPRLLRIASPKCVFAFGVRRGRYKAADFQPQFGTVRLTEGTCESNGERTREDILVLAGPR